MSKTLKMSMLLIIITLGVLFLGTEVKAVEVNSKESLFQAVDTQSATITDTKITLTADIDTDIVDFCEYDWVLDLNGHKLTATEFYINDGSLTINDSTGKGAIECSYSMICEGAKAVINNGIFDTAPCALWDNSGEMIINNGTFHSIWNFGTLTINDGSFKNILQEGKAAIKGGTFTAYHRVDKLEDGTTGEFDYFTQFNLDAETVITGGEFKAIDLDYIFSIMSNTENVVQEDSINQLIGEGYVADYKISGSPSEWDVYYKTLKIEKKLSDEDINEIINKIAPNGVWTVNSYKPNNPRDGQSLLTALLEDCIDSSVVKEAYAWYDEVPEEATINLEIRGCSEPKVINVKVKYNEPKQETKPIVNKTLSEMKKLNLDDIDEKTSYRVEDLYLINYLKASSTGLEDISKALNFSKELIEASNGSNISFRFIGGFGGGDPDGLYTYVGGQAVVYFDNIAQETINAGVTMNHLLYIPEDTPNTTDAYKAAAMKRIKDYLGTTEGIKIEVGRTFESLNKYDQSADRIITWNENDFIDEKTSGNNYYNLTINGKTYKFAICKKEMAKLETPEYLGSDIVSNISIKSKSTELPLDTSITVKTVTSDDIENALGTEEYAAYDISLFSNVKEQKISKLTKGEFEVNIPLPKKLQNKTDLMAYYIEDGVKKEEYEVDVKDGFASFKTNHFSVYVLTENKETTNPGGIGESKEESYKVVFDANGGKFAGGKETLTIEKWKIGDEKNLEKPTKEGYEFVGYYTQKTEGTSLESYIAEAGIDRNLTFYAQWKEVKTDNTNKDNTGNTIPNEENNNTTGNNPQTGDNIILVVAILAISIVGVIVTRKIKKDQKEITK